MRRLVADHFFFFSLADADTDAEGRTRQPAEGQKNLGLPPPITNVPDY